MGMFTVIPLIGVTNGSGAKVITSESVNGLLYGLHEDKGDLANGVDMTLAVVNSEAPQTILTLTNADTDNTEFFPRVSSCGATGTSNSDSLLMIPIVGRLQLTIAQGGDTKTGGLYAYVMVD